MSTANGVNRAAAEKLEAEKKATEDVAAAIAASAWPIGGYNSFIPLSVYYCFSRTSDLCICFYFLSSTR